MKVFLERSYVAKATKSFFDPATRIVIIHNADFFFVNWISIEQITAACQNHMELGPKNGYERSQCDK